MAVLGRLVVPVLANTSPFAREMARAAKIADSWSKTIGGKVDAAFGGVSRSAGPLGKVAGYLDLISKGTSLGRLAATGADVYRTWKTAGNAMDVIRLGFTFNAQKAEVLRNKIADTSAAMNMLQAATMRARWALFKVDLGVFAGRLAVITGRAIPGFIDGLAKAAFSAVRFTAGIAQTTTGIVMLVPNIYRMTKALVGVVVGAGGGMERLRSLFAAKYVTDRVLSAVGDLTQSLFKATGMAGDAKARIGAVFAAKYAGSQLAAAVSGVTGAARRLYDVAGGLTDRLTSLFAANYYGGRVVAALSDIYQGARSTTGAVAGVAGGLVQMGASLVRVGWRTATAAATGLGLALRGAAAAAASLARTLAVGGFLGVLAGGKAAGGLIGISRQAAQLEDSMAAVRSIFGKEADAIEAHSRKMAVALGLDMKTSADAAARMGSMFTGVGFDAKSAAQYTVTLSRLAQDFVAAFGGTTDEAMAKIFSGLSGEAEPLRAYGIFLDDAAINAQALKMGLKSLNGEFTAGQKIQARAAFILDHANAAVGQSIREADSAAAKIAAMSGRWENLKATIGETFAPVVGAAMGEVGTVLETLRTGWADNEKAASGWASSSVGGMGAVSDGAGFVQRAVMGIADAWQSVGRTFMTVQVAIMSGMTRVVEMLSKVAAAMGGAGGGIAAALGVKDPEAFGVGAAAGLQKALGGVDFGVMFESMRADLEKMTKDLSVELAKPRASDDLRARFAETQARIKGLQDELAKTSMKLEPGKLTEDVLDKAKGTAGRLANFAARGSKEDAAITYRTRYGGGADKAVQQTAQNTKKAADNAEATVDILGKVDAGIQQMLGRIGQAAGEFIF